MAFLHQGDYVYIVVYRLSDLAYKQSTLGPWFYLKGFILKYFSSTLGL